MEFSDSNLNGDKKEKKNTYEKTLISFHSKQNYVAWKRNTNLSKEEKEEVESCTSSTIFSHPGVEH